MTRARRSLLLLAAICASTHAPVVHASLAVEGPRCERSERVHSHNDYDRQLHPLWDALALRVHSVEADVWLDFRERTFWLSHLGLRREGWLEETYLKPMQALVDERGSVLGDGRDFYLWIDIKEPFPGIAKALHQTLLRYPMLAPGGNVHVILTGRAYPKNTYAAFYRDLSVTRDSTRYVATDPTNVPGWDWYTLKWSRWIGWNGLGSPPDETRARGRRGLCRRRPPRAGRERRASLPRLPLSRPPA